jgi:PAT family acetyl-CoA transporter-like MFS transporter 1
LVSLELFLKVCGVAMCAVTVAVGIFKTEISSNFDSPPPSVEEDEERDAADIGIKETYSRLIKCCRLPTVRWLVLVLLTYRFPVALSDNVKFLKALDYGLPKATVSLLAPTVILPLGILTPIVATKIWSGKPLQQFVQGYKFRLTLVAICDLAMLQVVKHYSSSPLLLYSTLIVSTALQTVASSLQFNAQMTFFASRVDRNIGGSYMTLLNTFANLGGTWPASPALWIMGKISGGGGDGYAPMQLLLSGAGIAYLVAVNGRIKWLGESKEEDWTTESMEGGDGTKKSKAKSKKGV